MTEKAYQAEFIQPTFLLIYKNFFHFVQRDTIRKINHMSMTLNIHSHYFYSRKCKENMILFTTGMPLQKNLNQSVFSSFPNNNTTTDS